MSTALSWGVGHSDRRKAAAGNDRLTSSKSELLAEAPSTYRDEAVSPRGDVTPFPLNWKTRRARASFRLADIIKLAKGRRHLGLSVDPGNFAFALASTLGAVPAGPYGIPNRQRFLKWYGLNLESLRHSIDRAELGSFSDAELGTIIESVVRYGEAHGQKLMSATATGRLLAVTSAERAEFDLRQIEAVDEPRAERIERRKEAHRKRERERKRAIRGCLPRHLSASQQKPWIAEGVCRRTWERRRSRVAILSKDVLFSQGDGTNLRQGMAPLKIQTGAGPARSGGAKRGVGADVHSHGGKTRRVEGAGNGPPPLSGGDGAARCGEANGVGDPPRAVADPCEGRARRRAVPIPPGERAPQSARQASDAGPIASP